jgi:hypothetical protein
MRRRASGFIQFRTFNKNSSLFIDYHSKLVLLRAQDIPQDFLEDCAFKKHTLTSRRKSTGSECMIVKACAFKVV